MNESLKIAEFEALIEKKDIKNLHISVNPPKGELRVSMPKAMSMELVRLSLLKRLAWIRKQKSFFKAQEREGERLFLSGENHYLLGKRYILKLKSGKNSVEKREKELILRTRKNASKENKKKIMKSFYKNELLRLLKTLIPKCEAKTGLKAKEYKIRSMKTRWGSCLHEKGVITLNLELAKKPIKCIEYVLLHELCHIKERTHTKAFFELLKKVSPRYKEIQKELNDGLIASWEDFG